MHITVHLVTFALAVPVWPLYQQKHTRTTTSLSNRVLLLQESAQAEQRC